MRDTQTQTDRDVLDGLDFPTPKSWGPTEVARYLGISVRHLNKTRGDDPTFPPARLVGTLPRWHPADIELWLRLPVAATADERKRAGRKGRGSTARV